MKLLKEWFGKKNEKDKHKSLLYLNQPISEEEYDWIGVSSYVDKIQTAIEQGAKMVAITSDFGGGKSSLIQLLQKRYKFKLIGTQYRFYKVNLWCHLSKKEQDTAQFHKTLLYQLANQIHPRKGSYINKRLSKNYGLIKIGTNNYRFSILTFLTLFLAIMGKLLDYYLKSLMEHSNWLEQWGYPLVLLMYIGAICIGIYLLMKADLIFSSPNSEGSREIEENDIIDLYQSMILCQGHRKSIFRPKHYIVLVEDVDRTESGAEVLQFLKEIRKYYMPNNMLRTSKNSVTFIINIKPEALLVKNSENDKPIYPKIFDCIINLQSINIDNYDVILEGLIHEKKDVIKKIGLNVYEEDNVNKMKGMQWIIRGKNLRVREIKERLNSAFLLYESLTSKFGYDNIDFEKCAVVSYISSAFAQDFYKVGDRALDQLMEGYISGQLIDIDDYKILLPETISSEYINEIKALIESKHIDSNYRTYFYNYPKGSNIFNAAENKVWNTIIYNEKVENGFEELVSKLNDNNSTVIVKALDKVESLGINFPAAIFESPSLFMKALYYFEDHVIKTITEHFRYDEEGISKTKESLKRILNLDTNRIYFNERIAKRLCNIWEERCSQTALCQIRQMICETFPTEVSWYRPLFMNAHPLISKEELQSINDLSTALKLVNRSSDELEFNTVKLVHNKVMNSSVGDIPIMEVEQFYDDILEIFEESSMVNNLLEYMIKINKIIDPYEQLIYEHINEEEQYLLDYTKLINSVPPAELRKTTLENLHNLEVYDGLSEEVCQQQYRYGFYLDYILSMVGIDIKKINFEDINIQSTLKINCMKILNKHHEVWSLIRYRIVEKYSSILDVYLYMFDSQYPLISNDELILINNLQLAIKCIDKSLVTSEDLNMIADYFNRKRHINNEIYEILIFTSSLQAKLAHDLFFLLDTKKVAYKRISKERKNTVKQLFKSSLNLINPLEILRFMEHVEELDEELEKELSETLKTDEELCKLYVALINVLEKFTSVTFQNIKNMGKLYAYSYKFNQELFKRKEFTTYVSSVVQNKNSFEIEKENLEVLLPVYLSILKSSSFTYTRSKMSENIDYLQLLMQKKAYVGLPEESRMYFTKINQSTECLEDAISYGESFAKTYFSKIVGFISKEAAEKFVEIINGHSELAISKEIYDNTHPRLVNPVLKSRYTRIRNRVLEE